MRMKLLATAVTAVLVTALSATSAQANHSWGGYHWARTVNPFTLKLGDNVTSAWDASSRARPATGASPRSSTPRSSPARTGRRTARPTTGRVEVCNATYGNTGWLGVASISITGGTHITRAP